MDLLKKQNWIVCLILNIATLGIFYIVLADFLNLFDKDAWYAKWPYWVFGALCLFFPAIIMLIVFIIEMNVKVAKKLNVSGSQIYDTPYTWLAMLIVPVIGWILLIIMIIYINLWITIKLASGEGEKYVS